MACRNGSKKRAVDLDANSFDAATSSSTASRTPTASEPSKDKHDRPRKKRKIGSKDATTPKQGLVGETRFQRISVKAIDRGIPQDTIVNFDVHHYDATDTNLSRLLQTADPQNLVFGRRHYITASRVYSELGPCAADLYWRHALMQVETDGTVADRNVITSLDANGKTRQEVSRVIYGWVFDMPNVERTNARFNVSHKFAKLVEILRSYASAGETFRGLIIVKRRAIAMMLVHLLQTLDDVPKFLRPVVLAAHGPFAESVKQQELSTAFSTGTYNLIVGTKFSEDVDLPGATTVIRYDLFDSQISQSYSYKRSLGEESQIFYFAEKDSPVHRRVLSNTSQMSPEMRTWALKAAYDPEGSIPPQPLHESLDPYRSDSDDEYDPKDKITDPTTGGFITKNDATRVIYHFISRYRGGEQHDADPLFEFYDAGQGAEGAPLHACAVKFPSNSGLPTVFGLPCTSMSEARRSACYHACSKLFGKRVLNYTMFPQQRRSLVTVSGGGQGKGSANALAANTSTNTHRYRRKLPEFWKHSSPATSTLIHPTIVFPESNEGHKRAPMLVLTGVALPDLVSFPVFDEGVPCSVVFQQGAPFSVNEDQLKVLLGYTTRICRAILNKPFTGRIENMAYFLAPLAPSWVNSDASASHSLELPTVEEHIAWDTMKVASESFATPLMPIDRLTFDECVEDTIVQDRGSEFTNRFFVIAVRHDLTPFSKADDSPREAGYANFVEYCKARRTNPTELKDEGQPMLQVLPVPVIVNHLSPMKPLAQSAHTSAQAPAKYLIPELSFRFPIPASIYRTVLLLPSIIRRVEELLLAKELSAQFFEHSIDERHLIIALTTASACAEYNYERLELLGDAFLKYICSVYCFSVETSRYEGELHSARTALISNNNLLAAASRIGLPSYILGKPFIARLWQPLNPYPDIANTITEGSGPRGNGSNNALGAPEKSQTAAPPPAKIGKRQRQRDEHDFQWLGDKTVADVAEAIIGAAYLTGGQDVAMRAVKALDVNLPRVEQWSDFELEFGHPRLDRKIPQLSRKSVTAIETILGCKFSKPYLLSQAMTHASVSEHDYQRLEFLGDAILDFLAVRYIYHGHPQLSPGGISLMKSAMVANHALAALFVYHGLHHHILHAEKKLDQAIRQYTARLQTLRKAEYELAATEKRSPGQYWLEVEPPKVLSDAMEAIVGALYVSESFSIQTAEALFDRFFKPFYHQHISLKTLAQHPNTTLFELLQAEGCNNHRLVKDAQGPEIRYEVLVHNVVLASASHPTASVAMRRTVFAALDALDGDRGFMMRTCDCRLTQSSKKVPKGLKASLGYSEEPEGPSKVAGCSK